MTIINVNRAATMDAYEAAQPGGILAMTIPTLLRGCCIAAISLSAGAATAMSPGQMPEAQPETWEQLLKIQLEDEKHCVLAGTVFVREMPGPEGITISGRVKCFDGRAFDFSQQKPHQKFDIRDCEPTVC